MRSAMNTVNDATKMVARSALVSADARILLVHTLHSDLPVVMKKARSKNRHSIAKARERRTRRALESKRVASKRRFLATAGQGQKLSQGKRWQRARNPRSPLAIVAAPSVFGLIHQNTRAELLRFLHKLKRLTLVHKQRVQVDFRGTVRMHPEGTILFAAELDSITRSAGGNFLVRCNRPRDRIVAQVLQHLGLFTMMGFKANAPITSDNVKYWRVNSDSLVDGRHTESLISDYKDFFSEAESQKLYKGLTEAMTNSKQHAYTQPRGDMSSSKLEERWWMFSQLKNETLSVSICDLGIGFKRSLLQGKNWASNMVMSVVEALGGGKRDSTFIRAAFELGKSRTKDPHRGKGLQELKTVIEEVGGWLQVMSNQGMYRYGVANKNEATADFDDSIFGTVISWSVPVVKKADKS